MSDLRAQLTTAIEDAFKVGRPSAWSTIERYGDLRAVAAAWDEHLACCSIHFEVCERREGIANEMRRLLGVKEAV